MNAVVPETRPILGVHHAAYRCRDVEQTIWFYRDVLGLVADGGLVIEEVPGSDGVEDPYMHIFFRMKNGEYIAFFDAPESADPAWFDRKYGFDMHYAFEVESEEAMLQMRDRINAMGVSCFGPIEHGVVRSVYMYDPNGIQIELTIRTDKHDELFAAERKALPQKLKEWQERTWAMKVEKFGEEALLKRGRVKS